MDSYGTLYLIRLNAKLTLNLSKSAGSVDVQLDANRDYVVSAALCNSLKNGECAPALDRITSLEPRVRNFIVNPFGGRGETLLFYAGAGGYGDQIMAAPVVKFLVDLGYVVTVATDAGNQSCWDAYPFAQAVVTLPMTYDVFRRFHHHALLEQVTNVDEHPGQLHPVDAMLNRIGVDPGTVDAARKAVAPTVSAAALEAADKFINGRQVGLYQLGGSGESRRIPPAPSRQLLMHLAEAVPDLMWLGLYDNHIPAPYGAPLPTDAPPNAMVLSFPSLAQMFAVSSKAAVGVGPDSFLSHVMGSYGRPFVGLWGPVSADLRMRYYRNHVPLANTAACPYAPCLRYKTDFEQCPPQAKLLRTCLVLHSIDPGQIVGAIHGLRLK